MPDSVRSINSPYRVFYESPSHLGPWYDAEYYYPRTARYFTMLALNRDLNRKFAE